jgi:exopolysaccharide/PEP-CTERM locus tyrosine autokinase
MNQHTSIKRPASLLERASQFYDFNAAIRAPVLPAKAAASVATEVPESAAKIAAPGAKPPTRPVFIAPEPALDEQSGFWQSASNETFSSESEAAAAPIPIEPPLSAMPSNAGHSPRLGFAASEDVATVDRKGLLENGYILPDAPVSALAEEFRIIKRQLLLSVGGQDELSGDRRQTVLVCSAQPDEGKTFCALNLALSLAGERDVEALLVDGDFAKPEILSILGLEPGPGLIDAIADPDCDPNALVVRTDIEGLSVLAAGRQANNASELLASSRTRDVLAALTRDHPRRIVIFDSPPALMASPASVLAGQIGQVLLVVRADQTTEADLRETVGLLSGCPNISLVLNGAGFAASGRRFGAYYGYGQ